MKSSYTLKADSWHFRLANSADSFLIKEDEVDFCEYFWLVFKGAIVNLSVCMMVLISVVLSCALVGDFLAWVVACAVMFSYIEPEVFAGILSVILTGGIAAYLSINVGNWINKGLSYMNKSYKEEVESPPGFIKVAYRKIKDKTCFKIDFE